MLEIDTEISVVWPSWCYSGKINCNAFEKYSIFKKDFDVNAERESNYTSKHKIQPTIDCSTIRRGSTTPSSLTTLALLTTANVGNKKMLSERSLLLSGYINNTLDSAKINCDINNTAPLAGVTLAQPGNGLTITPTSTAAAAAAYLYLEKVKKERMSPRVTVAEIDSLKDAIMESSAAAAVAAAMVNNNNNSNSNSFSNDNDNNNNNNNNINNSHNNINNSSSGSVSASTCNTNVNKFINSQAQNQIPCSSTNNTGDDLDVHSLTQSCSHQQQKQQQSHLQNQTHHHHYQQQQLALHMNSNHVKKEILSPGANGDLQTSLSRSRSTTPSSFRGTSPQNSIHSSPSDTLVPMHNLSTNLLNSINQAAASNRHRNLNDSSPGITSTSSGLPTDFSTRNYSDFMRSLAAKYNNTNPNDNLKRNALFEATSNNTTAQKKTATATQKTTYATSAQAPLNKEVTITTTSSLPPPPALSAVGISPGESTIKLSQQNKLAAAAAAACNSNVPPYMTTYLSSLPFSPGIFPPLIDMSSTQALITLARAVKENEIHNILSALPQQSKRSVAGTPPSPSPSINIALQQAAQFISPALIYSAQLQKQQLQQQEKQHHRQQLQAARQSSPLSAKILNSTTSNIASDEINRNLSEKVSVSPLDLSSQPPASKRFKAESTLSKNNTDSLMHATTTRRASSSTTTTSPSPPPLYEKSLNASTISSSRTEATTTTTAFTPIKVASSLSATSSTAPAVTVRQCQAQSEELNSWTVNDVCEFVSTIDICAEYVKNFRHQCIDGSGLPLLTEDHLVNSLGMKLGPALKLRSVLAKKLGGPCPCVSCVAQVQQVLALQTSAMTTTTTPTVDHTTGTNTTNVFVIDNNNKSINSCSSHLPKNSLLTNSSINNTSYNSGINSSVNKNENATTMLTSSLNIISTTSTTTNVCNSDETTTMSNTGKGNSSPDTIVDKFSSPPPPAAAISQQQQQQPSSENIFSSSNSSSNLINNRNDNTNSNS